LVNRAGARGALIVADGDVPRRAALDSAWAGWADDIGLVIAADGGWEKAASLGIMADVLVGDADSLPAERFTELAAAGVPIERAPVAKDESDAELALLAALRRGASHVTILGALGGKRFDHALANVGLLSLPGPGEAEVVLLDATTRVRLLRAPNAEGGPASCDLSGEIGDLISLLPQGGPASDITTEGLLYPLGGETLPPGPARGLSNVRIASDASVTLRRGNLLVIETRANQPTPEDQ
jgi:thiamine pyrophosphokinase